jgi:glycosyltransferase involved in cell wall biosynthesis
MSNLTICHIITRLIQGGADENTIYSCNGQIKNGHTVHLIVGSEVENEILSLLDHKVNIIKLNALKREISFIYDLTALFTIFKILRRINPDIVHTHTSKAGIVGRFAAYAAGTKGIIHGVHILPFDNVAIMEQYLYLLLERLAAMTTTAFVNVSEGLKDYCVKYKLGESKKHFVVPSGMDTKKFIAAGTKIYNWREVLKDHHIESKFPIFLTIVSRLESRKGQSRFLPIFKKINQEFPDTVLILVGNGKDTKKISQEIVKLELARSVVLTGLRKDVEELIAISDICLLTSEREGLPRVLIQYLFVGKPIITTECIGIENIIKNNINGYIVSHENLSEMIYPLRQLLVNKEIRQLISNENKLLNLEQWSTERMVSDLEEIYKNSIEDSGNRLQKLYLNQV